MIQDVTGVVRKLKAAAQKGVLCLVNQMVLPAIGQPFPAPGCNAFTLRLIESQHGACHRKLDQEEDEQDDHIL